MDNNTYRPADNQPVQPVQQQQIQPQPQPYQQQIQPQSYQQPYQPLQAQQPYQPYQPYQPLPKAPAHGMAIASLVLGIVSVVFWFLGVGAIVSLLLGIAGCVFANMAKKRGNNTGIRTAGFVLSLIGLIVGALILLVMLSCIGTAACLAGSEYLAGNEFFYY